MANKKYLDYAGLAHLVEKLNQEFAPIQAIIFKSTVEDIASLPALNTVKAGWMYNLKTGGITTDDFVEGAGRLVADGENVAAVEVYLGTYTAVPADQVTVNKDPKAEGWYELDGANYVLSQDRIADTTKTYYTADTVMKWDALGGLFDLEGRYLEFGDTFPQGPASRMVTGRTFLYMGDDTFEFEYVASPKGRPSDNGYYEVTFTPVADPSTYFNPKQQGLYEETSSGSGIYALSDDATVQSGKTYYTAVGVASTDTTVDSTKKYYTKEDQFKKAAIYEYDATTGDWTIQSSGTDDLIPITDAEIDELFI